MPTIPFSTIRELIGNSVHSGLVNIASWNFSFIDQCFFSKRCQVKFIIIFVKADPEMRSIDPFGRNAIYYPDFPVFLLCPKQ